jgi:hypothetical protein
VIEWYENRPEGVEQGFTITRRAPGAGEIRVAGSVETTFRIRAAEGGRALEFLDGRGATALRYDQLTVRDAAGRDLPARLEVRDQLIAIVVDDRGAAYPIVIDPLLSSPAWTQDSDQAGAAFGASVCTAGDVNGDGFSDVIVGAPGYDAGSPDEGAAFVFLGSGAGLETTASWIGLGNQTNSYYGGSVSTAGDVNGDGFDDVIVGGLEFNQIQFDAGAAWVYLGSDTGVVDAPHRTYFAPEPNEKGHFGSCVSTAGDVNGDGYADVAIGAPRQDGSSNQEGAVYVYHGSSTGLPATAPNWSRFGGQGAAHFGSSVASAGDVNADGYGDLIVGEPDYDNGQAESHDGQAYVFLGGAAGLAASPVWTVVGDQELASLGERVAGAGDVNGDGFADVLVSAPFYDGAITDEGRVWLYLGGALGPATSAQAFFDGGQFDALFGFGLGTLGDLNGDGYADFAIGTPYYDDDSDLEGIVRVYEGNASANWFLYFPWTRYGTQAFAELGASVMTAGDVNGDGYGDMILGVPLFDAGQTDEGRALIYYGSPSRSLLTASWEIEGSTPSANMGRALASAGDVNADGFGDVVVGVPNGMDGGYAVGIAYVHLGTAGGLAPSPVWSASGAPLQFASGYGWSVSGAGDVNGDGYDDVLIGQPNWGDGQRLSAVGRAHVYDGYFGGVQTSPAWTFTGSQTDESVGYRVSRAGDVNGDGFGDVIVGTLGDRVYVFYGSAEGLSTVPDLTISGASGSNFGRAVACAGDVNGDGFCDVLVGAPAVTPGPAPSPGAVFCYLGSFTGLATQPAWTRSGIEANEQYGESVAGAGDVNGDGRSDVVIGAPNATNGVFSGAGRAEVLYGTPGGLGNIPVPFTYDEAEARMGACVSAAGDVDGDGYGDVLLGAPGATSGVLSDAGFAQVVMGGLLGTTLGAVRRGGQAGENLGAAGSCAGDANGDGYADLVLGAPMYDGVAGTGVGHVRLYLGNLGEGLDRVPRMVCSDGTTPLAFLGRSDQTTTFDLRMKCRTAAGRDKVRMTFEVKPQGAAFDGAGVQHSTYAPAPGGAATFIWPVAGLSTATPYHWRIRSDSRNPFFPRTPWISLAYNSAGEWDVRTGGSPLGVGDELTTLGGHIALAAPAPNPAQDAVRFSWVLPAEGTVSLDVFDALGRRVARLAAGTQCAGRHFATWDGRGPPGARMPAGIYVACLSACGERRIVRVALMR